MHFIDHIIEPTKLLLAWQSLDESHRTRYIVAELKLTDSGVTLNYLTTTKDFQKAKEKGFESYPAFPDVSKVYSNVLGTFMRRLPPRSRGDFPQYLEGIRLRQNSCLTDFALLGYSGAKLLSDGFSIIHPFSNVSNECELLLEIAGFRHGEERGSTNINVDVPVSFDVITEHAVTLEPAIRILVDGKKLGYVNRGLVPAFLEWIKEGRILNAWIEKINGTPGRPTAYVYVRVAKRNET